MKLATGLSSLTALEVLEIGLTVICLLATLYPVIGHLSISETAYRNGINHFVPGK